MSLEQQHTAVLSGKGGCHCLPMFRRRNITDARKFMRMRSQNHRVLCFLHYIYMSCQCIYAICVKNQRAFCLFDDGFDRLCHTLADTETRSCQNRRTAIQRRQTIRRNFSVCAGFQRYKRRLIELCRQNRINTGRQCQRDDAGAGAHSCLRRKKRSADVIPTAANGKHTAIGILIALRLARVHMLREIFPINRFHVLSPVHRPVKLPLPWHIPDSARC